MDSRTPIIITGGTPYWGACSSQALRMAHAFHRLGYPVLYIECGGDERPFRARACQTRSSHRDLLPPFHSEMDAAKVIPDFDRAGLFVMRASQLRGLPLTFPDIARRWNCSRTSARAARFTKAAGWTQQALVIHYGWYFPELLDGRGLDTRHVYECLDDHASTPTLAGRLRAQRYLLYVEQQLLDKAELTVFSSPSLASKRKARRAEVVPLGVDAAHFMTPPKGDPHEPRGIGRPRIGFLGLVTTREDWDMVRTAAAMRPDWQWVVIGPRQGVDAAGPPNLHWIGAVDYKDLPEWTQNWDAGMIPLALSEFNRGSWPLKFYEYLASGLPIVTTPIPAAPKIAQEAPGLIDVASGNASAAAFVAAAEAALTTTPALRNAARAVAAAHTWEARAACILDLLATPDLK